MENSLPHQCVIITGMHRSGTSLTASLLQSAGIEIGDRLMAASEWNPNGFFEDWDFVELHQAILSSQGIAPEGWTKEKLVEVQGQYLAPAQDLILARKNKQIWGWKDPRTTLFLDFWWQLIPQAKFIFTFRSPWEVIDSLFRRGDPIFDTNPNFALEQWRIYNEAILDFYQRYREQCLLLDIRSIISDPNVIIDLIEQKFHLELRSPKSLYEPSLFKVDDSMHYRQALITKLFPQVIDLYNKLQQQSDGIFSSSGENQQLKSTYESWLLQDWHDLKKIENQKHELETHYKTLLKQTESLLQETQQKLQTTEGKLNQSENKLQIAQERIEQLKLVLVGMESSKFWQLRQWWFQLKQKFHRKETDSAYQSYLSSFKEPTPVEPSESKSVD